MNKKMKGSLSRTFGFFALALLANTACNAWQGGRESYHGHGAGSYHGHSRYYQGGSGDGGGYYNRGGWGAAPNIVIGVPLGGYYGPGYYAAPACKRVRVCNNRCHDCWLEQECN